ncbi:MAG: hypothetical protein R8K20_11940 [Gallionellaceae bacterium]
MNTIIPAQTAAATAGFTIGDGFNRMPTTVICIGLVGTETASVEVSSNGTTYVPLMDYITETAVFLNVNRNAVIIKSSGFFRVVKSVTAAAVDVAIAS